MTTVHLICGLPCAGKSTYSEVLKAETKGVHFALDYWLITSFGTYDIEEAGYEEHVRRVSACRKLIWEIATEFLIRDIDVILDDGFFFREHRIQYSVMAGEFKAITKVHYIDTSTDTIRQRIESRNNALPTYNFRIDPDRIEDFINTFEIPSPDEGMEIIVVS
jgi:predicted kinase